MSIITPDWVKRPFFWAIFLASLIHVSGAIGMSFFDRIFFVPFTPLNLLLMLLLLVLNERAINGRFVKAFLVAVAVGMLSEMLGVNTGLLFGDYAYGDVFGAKLFGVPPLIGINWFCVVFSAYVVAERILQRAEAGFLLKALLTAVITTGFDWIMEPVAMELGFWNWRGAQIPIFNYVSWFMISFFVALIFHWLKVETINRFAPYFLLIQAIFFIFLRFGLAHQS